MLQPAGQASATMQEPLPARPGRRRPILFACYVIAYVDRNNVGLAKLKMIDDIPGFNDAVIGFGAGFCFFTGYLLLEIPGTLLVEKWARKWICRIAGLWGIVMATTSLVKTPLPVLRGAVPARAGRGQILPRV